mmetsp:Transcript_7962/g.22807  ORF Transcript_7962/g.22807 Transcript_7962/m.22807 type:complete len:230 (-) Transcript_7962:193-882(-)
MYNGPYPHRATVPTPFTIQCFDICCPLLCRDTSLRNPEVEVHSKVYASPNQTQLSCTADSREELPEKPDICWPDISFAVSNFEEEFESMVVSGPDSCFCVVLRLVRSSFLTPASHKASTALLPGEVAFSGLVSRHQLEGAMQGSSSKLLSYFFPAAKTKKVTMRGPGGRGRAEVAVTKLEPEEAAGAAAVSFRGCQAMRCCLMNLTLPWETVAACILRTVPPTDPDNQT